MRQGTQHFTDENKVSRNEVILSTYYHYNLIRTTPLLIEFWLSKFKTKNQLSYNIYYKTHSQLYMRPTNQSLVPNLWMSNNNHDNNCSIVISFAMFPFPWYVQASIPLHYRTSQKPRSAFSVKPFKSQCKWIPFLVDKILALQNASEIQSSCSWVKSNSVFQTPKLFS